MKLSLSLLLLSIGSVVAQLGDPAFVAALTRTTTTTCATTNTTITATNLLLEGFQVATTGYENTWTGVGTTANITVPFDTSALSSGKVAGMCNQGFKCVNPDATAFIDWDKGSAITYPLDMVVYLWVATAPENARYTRLLVVRSTADDVVAGFRIVGTADANAPHLYGRGSSSSSEIAISLNTWIKVSFHLDSTSTACSIAVNDGVAQTFTRQVAYTPQKIGVGASANSNTGTSGLYYLDLICGN